MIPICLVTGFLGTGKTTLLKRIVAQNRDRRWVYLVNEFSALDVDGAMVSEENPNVVSIPGGSIFCKCLVTEFIGQMTKIHERHGDVEGVVIEASGMADPRVIADMLRETGLDRHFGLGNLVSIVEPRSFRALVHTLPNIVRQVEAANRVLVNKCDLFDEGRISETEQAVREINPEARIVRCVNADAGFPVFGNSVPRSDLHGDYAKCRDPNYATFTTDFDHPIDPATLERLILENEASIYRVKGVFQTLEGPVRFDYSKAGFQVSPADGGRARGLAWIVQGGKAAEIQALADALGR